MKLLASLMNSMLLTVLMCCLESVVVVCSSLCPSSCSCFLSGSTGGVIVNCSARDLTSLPVDLPSDVTELIADQNPFETLSPLPVLEQLKKINLQHCKLKYLNHKGEPNSVHSENLPNLQVLDLAENELSSVTPDLPSSLQILHYSHNDIQSIEPELLKHLTNLHELFLDHNLIIQLQASVFVKPGDESKDDLQTYLSQLQRLALNNNQISRLEPHTFQPLKLLVALSLSGNRLTHLDQETFSGLEELKHLDLSHNHLVLIANSTFKKLESLKHLYLNNNRLTSVPWGLPMLEWFDLSSNLLQTFPEEFKSDLFPAEVFNIAGNPLICDCHLLWLKELYDRREYLFKHLNVDSVEFVPVCHGPPTVAGDSWDMLSDDLFLCEGDDVRTRKPNSITSSSSNSGEAGRVVGKLVVKCGFVTDSTIEVHWSVESLTSFNTLYVHYYVFGKRDKTSKFTQVSIKKLKLTIDGLRPEMNYIVCLIPKLAEVEPEKLSPLSLEHCVETRTKEPPPVLIVSYLTVFWYYLLGMLATVIAIFSCIGGLALVYGVVSSKTDWSAKNMASEIDPPSGVSSASQSVQEILKKSGKPHAD